ncbi:MAG: hypothetical protein NTZ74_14775 [Chloroflexi bacterium]|nr:hypothetical protein [Chloroflexota bacterium]
MAQFFDCSICGAPVELPLAHTTICDCPYCGRSVQVPAALNPYLSRGKLLQRVDFNDPRLPGWEQVHPENQKLVPGNPVELQANYPPSDLVHYILKTSGFFEDLDAAVTIRFLEGDCGLISAGMFLRYQDGSGGYCILISAQSSYVLGCYETPPGGELVWKTIMDWKSHSALLAGLNQSNRVRMVALGSHLKVYLNEMLATSIRDDLYQKGQFHLAAEPGNKSSISVAFSNLELREPVED